MERLSAVVVSYQVSSLLRKCLETLETQIEVEVEVLVVDNASADGSADMVETTFPEVRLLRNAHNLGFARATNQGMSLARGDLIALINPDTELPPSALATIVGVFERHPRAGAVGLTLTNPDGTRQPACFAFPGLWNLCIESLGLHRLAARLGLGSPSFAPIPAGGEGEVDWVSGAFLVVSRRAYEAVGGLDEGRFMYGEEMDWCWRARRRGFTTVFSDRARIIHHGGASGSGLRGPLFVRNVESRVHFLAKHRGRWRAAAAREILFVGSLLRWCIWVVRERIERANGAVREHTRDQLERFAAVIAWRIRGA